MSQDVSREPAGTAGRLTIGVPRETVEGEKRVGLIPESIGKLAGDVDFVVEAGAGEGSSISDDEYREAGATVVPDAAAVFEQADLIVKVQAPQAGSGDVDRFREGQALISLLAPLVNHDLVQRLADKRVTAMAMDAVPRISRAQSMDALSAMSNIGGYKSVLLAANHLPKLFPLLMTAAGTIKPARVLVIGAGVAGLQAIATARRLGAVVEAYDTRPVVKEQVESLGAKFVEIDTGADDTQTAGGYAREATAEELRRQQEGLNAHIAQSDVVITTALVPGRPAPQLIPASAVESMSTGSVIVDLAAETGGNCELTEPGEIVTRHGVTIIGLLNLPSLLPLHSSQMFSRVVQNLLGLLLKDGQLNLNMDDEIIRGIVITRDGEVIQEPTRKAMGLGEAPAAVAEPEAAPDPGPEPDASDAAGSAGNDAREPAIVEGAEPGAEAVEVGEVDVPTSEVEDDIVANVPGTEDEVEGANTPVDPQDALVEAPETEIEEVVIEDEGATPTMPEEAREESGPIPLGDSDDDKRPE